MTLDQRLTRAVQHVADTVTVPEVDLAAIRTAARANRRRQLALAAVAAVAVVVVGVGVAGAALSGGQRSEGPAQEPSPSLSDAWTPERIRDEGTPGDVIAATESDLTARIYVVCDGPLCDSDGGGPSENKYRALEVTHQGQTALFVVSGIGGQGPWIRVFDDDSVLVEDTAPDGVWPEGPARFRLLRADGTEVPLRLVEDPAPAAPGTTIVVIDDFRRHGAGMGGGQESYVVDDLAGTLRPLERPAGGR